MLSFFKFQDDYRAWDIQKIDLYKPEQAYHPPTVKFGNSTTFQDDYAPQEIKPRQSFKPSPVVKHSTVPFWWWYKSSPWLCTLSARTQVCKAKRSVQANQSTLWGSHNSPIWLSGSSWWNCENLQTSIHQSDPKCSFWRKHGIPRKLPTMGNPTTRSQETTGVCPACRYHAAKQHKPSRLCSLSDQTC